jgi:transcriptional regulator with XRE-family HTH domain
MGKMSTLFSGGIYNEFMPIGRPTKQSRTAFGHRLLSSRDALGLSQAQVAEQLGITQPSYADWERYPVALRPEQVAQLARILKVSLEFLFGYAPIQQRRGGPTGRLHHVLEKVSALPRHQQNKVIEFVEAFTDRQMNGQHNH